MQKRLISVLFGLIGLCLLQACFCGEDSPPFFDYASLDVKKAIVADNVPSTLTLVVSPADLSFLASAYGPNLAPGLMALSCPEPGRDGAKHPITAIEIFANQPFNDTLPAGASLNSLFLTENSPNTPPLNMPDDSRQFLVPEWVFFFTTTALPKDPSQVFTLTVRITKANGSIAEGSVAGVKFE